MQNARLKRKLMNELGGYLFTLPVLLGVLIFTYYPAVQSLIYSFFEYDGFVQMNPVGFRNFIRIFTLDRETGTVFLNTFVYAVITVPLGLVLGYSLALLANTRIRGISAFRVLFYLPVIIPGVSAGILWRDLFDPTFGIMAQIFRTLGLPEPTFFAEASTSMATLVWTTTWSMGGGMVIWLAAFKNIPAALYESARLDGAGYFRQLFSITIPLSTPMIFYNLVTSIIFSMQAFTQVYMLTNGGPTEDTMTMVFTIYNYGIKYREIGQASSMAWFLFVIIFGMTMVVFRTNKWVYYEGGDA